VKERIATSGAYLSDYALSETLIKVIALSRAMCRTFPLASTPTYPLDPPPCLSPRRTEYVEYQTLAAADVIY
jgi:hypothetical protein